MSRPPYCLLCGVPLSWGNDYNCSDYGFDVDGIVGLYSCSSCEVTHHVIDVFLEDSQLRIIKYDIDREISPHIEYRPELNNCLLCSNLLDKTSTNTEFIKDILIDGTQSEKCLTNIYKCDSCGMSYTLVDKSYYNDFDLYDDFEFYTKNVYMD